MFTISLITLFNPGHNPPQVTIAAFTDLGSKYKCFLGPALNHFFVSLIDLSGPNEHYP